MWLWMLPVGLLFAFGAISMGWDMVRSIPGSIYDVFHPKIEETTCQTLLRTMKSEDDAYDAMIENCLSQP